MRSKYFTLIIVFLLFGDIANAIDINYQVSFPEPHTHYADVIMEVSGFNGEVVDIKMPVWIPGSYMIREFSRFVDSFEVLGSGNKGINFEKIEKNKWRVYTKGESDFQIRYKVYAYELSVRTSFIDQEHAYLNGSSIFMYADEFLNAPVTVKINPDPAWKNISVALDRINPNNAWYLKADNYDDLIDAPFEIGNHVVFNFTAAGVPHEVAMVGEGNYNVAQLKKDMVRIVEECTSIFGENPSKRYVFIFHNSNTSGGGLEHKNSTTIQANRWGYTSSSVYNGFLSLVAHEYFHLWNVKRMRPVPLGPFNYDQENYTDMLWFVEGFTGYYDDLITYRCGFSDEAEYLRTIAGSMSYCSNQMGAAYQSLSESSLDAWIKYYRSHENSNNSTVSYYTKGGVVGALLDMEIIAVTNGKKSLDDVMFNMYQEYYVKNDKAFTKNDFMKMVEMVSGKNMNDFIENAVNTTSALPMKKVIAQLGLSFSDLNEKDNSAFSGINSSASNGKLSVTSIIRNSPAWKSGIYVNDELVFMDQYRIGDDLSKFSSMKSPGDKVVFTVNRGGFLKSIPMTFEKTPFVKYVINKDVRATEQNKTNFKKWLRLKGDVISK